MIFSKIVQAGGVEAAVASEFDVEMALDREMRRAAKEFAREICIRAKVAVSEDWWDGDYKKRLITVVLL